MNSNRYIFDALYGRIYFPEYIWNVFNSTELQRLREVRLCNINSLTLTGGANINRYEHSLGTAYLALKNLEAWPWGISDKMYRAIVLAALLHDVGSGAFGHSVQYVLDKEGFEHESIYDMFRTYHNIKDDGFRYQNTLTEPIYFGLPRRLHQLLPDDELHTVNEIVSGKGDFGPLINGTIDLDNIDNVFRLAYHIGLVKSGEIPLHLAQSISIKNRKLVILEKAIPLMENWYQTRTTLYKYLLLNPDEFSAKCMLQEALDLAQITSSSITFKWYYVDFELLSQLQHKTSETSTIISRLIVGDLYGCLGIFETNNIDVYNQINNPQIRMASELKIDKFIHEKVKSGSYNKANIALHVIKDVNKTQRRLELTTIEGDKVVIGDSSHRLLIGVFLKNVNFSMSSLNYEQMENSGIKRVVVKSIKEIFHLDVINELPLYAEEKSV